MFVRFSFVKWTEEFFSSYGWHGNQGNGVFVVFMATEGKYSSVYFRKLMCASIPWGFQPKATIGSLEKMLQPVPLLPVIRALYLSNGF